MPIPAPIRRKLARIERLQREVKRLVAECEAALGLGDYHDEESQWCWVMHVDQQGTVLTAAETEALAEQFLERKASDVAASAAGKPTNQ